MKPESGFAIWLDEFFWEFDHSILSFCHELAKAGGDMLTTLVWYFSQSGELGISVFILSGILFLFSGTRKMAVCTCGSVCFSSLFTTFSLKHLVARVRPFMAVDLYREWWEFLGSPPEDSYSFPSGHVTAAMAGVTALLLVSRKKAVIWGYLYVLFMGFTRVYLMAHYPSDVLAGIIIGTVAALLSFGITNLIYSMLKHYEHTRLVRFYHAVDILWIVKWIRHEPIRW